MGLAQPLDWTRSARQGWVLRPSLSRKPEATTVCVVAAPGFPDHDLIRTELRRGVAALPKATWVVPFGPAQRNGELLPAGVVRETLESLGVEVFVARKCQNFELAACATKVVVFCDQKSHKTRWYTDRAEQPWGKSITVVERPAVKRAA